MSETVRHCLNLSSFFDYAVQTALWWDAWSRPSPDLGSELREKERGTKTDPNFVDNLPRFMAAGRSEDRTTPDLPSDLRLAEQLHSSCNLSSIMTPNSLNTNLQMTIDC